MCELNRGQSGWSTEPGRRQVMKVTLVRQSRDKSWKPIINSLVWGAIGSHLGLLSGSVTVSGVYFVKVP